jgi:hypothetical protein
MERMTRCARNVRLEVRTVTMVPLSSMLMTGLLRCTESGGSESAILFEKDCVPMSVGTQQSIIVIEALITVGNISLTLDKSQKLPTVPLITPHPHNPTSRLTISQKEQRTDLPRLQT